MSYEKREGIPRSLLALLTLSFLLLCTACECCKITLNFALGLPAITAKVKAYPVNLTMIFFSLSLYMCVN